MVQNSIHRRQASSAWEMEVQILKIQMRSFSDGRIIFEYTIPRMGKRVDVVVLYRNIVFLLEFKCGDTEYRQSTYDQVYDYALDLRNNYFNALYQGIPVGGYTRLVENLLEGIEVRLGVDYLEHKDALDALAERIV